MLSFVVVSSQLVQLWKDEFATNFVVPKSGFNFSSLCWKLYWKTWKDLSGKRKQQPTSCLMK